MHRERDTHSIHVDSTHEDKAAKIYIHTYLHTHIPIYTHTYIHTYLYTHIPTYTHTYIHTYLYTHIPTYTHTYIHTYLYTHIPTYTHTLPGAKTKRQRSGPHGSLARLCHIIIHTVSHHPTYCVTSSYILCHIIIGSLARLRTRSLHV
jgi:hypothetical protein